MQMRTSVIARMSMATVLAMLVAACGPLLSDDDEPTPTAEVSEGQTTSAVSGSPAATTPRSSLPANTDMSTVAGSATPSAAASPMVIASPVNVAGTPAATSEANPAGGTPQPAVAVGDGTTGPEIGRGMSSASPAASPAAAPGVVTTCTPDVVPPFGGASAAYVVTEDLNFRAGPGTDCPSIGDGPLAAGTAVTVVGGPVVRQGEEDLEWLQIDVGGVVGWVAADFVNPAA